MPASDPSVLVSTAWLADHISAPDVRVVDASYYLPGEGLDPRAEFELQRIPGAVFFDIDEIADTSSPLPHMLPAPEKFSSRVRKLGLGDGVRIVVYDQRGIFSAPRVWWSFHLFGHEDVAVLDGGLPKWMAEGRKVEDGPGRAVERNFTARMDTTMVRDKAQMLANLKTGREQVVDARSRGRFEGRDPEPRPELRGGHIPGSLNLPFTDLMEMESQTMKPRAEIAACLAAAGIDPRRPVTTTCGSGITAAVLALGLHMTGHRGVAVYDGSWCDWGAGEDTPVETGA